MIREKTEFTMLKINKNKMSCYYYNFCTVIIFSSLTVEFRCYAFIGVNEV